MVLLLLFESSSLHLDASFLEEFVLFPLILAISLFFFNAKALLQLVPINLLAITTREGLKLLGVRNTKDMASLVASELNLAEERSSNDFESHLGRHVHALHVILFALIAPVVVGHGGTVHTSLRSGSSSCRSGSGSCGVGLLGHQGKIKFVLREQLHHVDPDEEGVVVGTLKLQRCATFTDTVRIGI